MSGRLQSVTPAGQQSVAPAGQVRVGLVGLGPWGARLLRAIDHHASLALEWVCDLDAARLRTAGGACVAPGRRETPALTTRLAEMLEDRRLDAVVIAAAPGANGELALEVLRSGKHVLVEKPFATSLSLGRVLAREAQERNLVACVGHILRYHPAYSAVEAFVSQGTGGAPWAAFAERLGSHRRRELSPWWVLAPHDLSLLSTWFGQAAREVSVTGTELLDAHLGFARGAFGRLILGRAERRRRMHLFTERAIVRVDEDEPSSGVSVCFPHPDELAGVRERVVALRSASLHDVARGLDGLSMRLAFRPLSTSGSDALVTQLEAFAAAVRGGSEPVTSVRASLQVLEMLVSGEALGAPAVAVDAALGDPIVSDEVRPRAAAYENHGAA